MGSISRYWFDPATIDFGCFWFWSGTGADCVKLGLSLFSWGVCENLCLCVCALYLMNLNTDLKVSYYYSVEGSTGLWLMIGFVYQRKKENGKRINFICK